MSVLGKVILLRTSSPDMAREASALLRATGNEVVVDSEVETCTSVLEAGGVDLIVADASDGVDLRPLLEETTRRSLQVVLICSELDSEALERFCEGGADHVVYGPERIEATAIAAEKILRGALFGIEKYTGTFGFETYAVELGNRAEIDRGLQNIAAFLDVIDAPRDFAVELLPLAKELAENALYSAPRDSRNRRLYTQSERQHGVEVRANERVVLSYAFDGKRFLFSVKDRFGSLSPKRLRTALGLNRKQGRHSPRATAMGLMSVWSAASELVFNIDAGVATEIIVIRDVSKNARRCGLHLFQRSLVTNEVTTSAESIRVSDSMLVDIRDHLAHSQLPPIVPKSKLRRARATIKIPPPRGRLVSLPADPLGIDTIIGLLHGAGSIDRVLEIALRFMTVCYEGAVAYAIEAGVLAPLVGAGTIADWRALRMLTLDLDGESRLSELCKRGISSRYQPGDTAIDRRISACTVGAGHAAGDVLIVDILAHPCFAIFGFGPRYGRHLARKPATRFEHELESVLTRISHPSVIADQRTGA